MPHPLPSHKRSWVQGGLGVCNMYCIAHYHFLTEIPAGLVPFTQYYIYV